MRRRMVHAGGATLHAAMRPCSHAAAAPCTHAPPCMHPMQVFGYTYMSEVQDKAIPLALEGRCAFCRPAQQPQAAAGSALRVRSGAATPQVRGARPRAHANLLPAGAPDAPSSRDVLAKAKTGTGKTLAVLIPAVERLSRQAVVRAPSPSAGQP